jgi:hypothetical protein
VSGGGETTDQIGGFWGAWSWLFEGHSALEEKDKVQSAQLVVAQYVVRPSS